MIFALYKISKKSKHWLKLYRNKTKNKIRKELNKKQWNYTRMKFMKLKIAVPSKGRISDPAVNILEKAGLGLKDNSNR